MPSRDAVSRSIVSRASNPLFCQSLVTSTNAGSARISRSTRGAQAVRSFRLSPWIVYWYCALLNLPPTRMSCTGCSDVWAPGTRGQLSAHPGDHFVRGDLPLVQVLQADEQPRRC